LHSASLVEATVIAHGNPCATSFAKLGPDSTPVARSMRPVCASTSATMAWGSAPVCGSKPLHNQITLRTPPCAATARVISASPATGEAMMAIASSPAAWSSAACKLASKRSAACNAMPGR
jgi:hypothetical protein